MAGACDEVVERRAESLVGRDVEHVTAARRGRDLAELHHIDGGSNADGVDLDAAVFGQLRFRQRAGSLLVRLPVRDDQRDVRHVRSVAPCALLRIHK